MVFAGWAPKQASLIGVHRRFRLRFRTKARAEGNTYVEGEALGSLPAIEDLSLIGSPVTDRGLAALAGLTSLRRLSLAQTDITDQGLAHLKPLAALRDLDLTGADVGDEGLAHLKDLPAQ